MFMAILVILFYLLIGGCSAKYEKGSTEVEMGFRGKVHIEYRK